MVHEHALPKADYTQSTAGTGGFDSRSSAVRSTNLAVLAQQLEEALLVGHASVCALALEGDDTGHLHGSRRWQPCSSNAQQAQHSERCTACLPALVEEVISSSISPITT